MITHSSEFAAGFTDECQRRGLSVKVAAALLWRARMEAAATPAFIEGIKDACDNTPTPPIPDIRLSRGPVVDRNVIKSARAAVYNLDVMAEETPNTFLKTSFLRQRNDIQKRLNDYILGS